MINPELFLVTIFFGFFAIMNPTGNVTNFISLTKDRNADAVKQIALIAVTVSFLVITIITLFGNYFFEFLSLSIGAFRIAGGIFIAIAGFQLINGKNIKSHTPGEAFSREKRSDKWLAIFPIALPMISGPGTILLALNFSSLHQGELHTLVILVGLALNCLICYFIFISGQSLISRFGADMINVISRIMGLVIMVMGIQMFISGFREVYKTFNL